MGAQGLAVAARASGWGDAPGHIKPVLLSAGQSAITRSSQVPLCHHRVATTASEWGLKISPALLQISANFTALLCGALSSCQDVTATDVRGERHAKRRGNLARSVFVWLDDQKPARQSCVCTMCKPCRTRLQLAATSSLNEGPFM